MAAVDEPCTLLWKGAVDVTPIKEDIVTPRAAAMPAALNGRYQILRELGTGGMACVYLAEDTRLPRLVAVKTIRPQLCTDAEILKRIDRECALHAKIGAHPNIVTLHDRYDEDGRIHLIMEYVPGETLQEHLVRSSEHRQCLRWEQGVGIVGQILEALSRIHSVGIVHRDIKPSNIMLVKDELGRYTAKLMDFGIARFEVEEEGYTMLTREGGSGPGTPLYMAPEQIDPQTWGAISPATDLYAVGIMLYQLISGRTPFSGSLTSIFNGHVNVPAPPIDAHVNVPPGMSQVLSRVLAKNPTERFGSAHEFREALEQLGNPKSGQLGLPALQCLDTYRTISGAEMSALGFEKGATLLDPTAGRGTRRAKGRLAFVAVAAAMAITAVAAGLITLSDGTARKHEPLPEVVIETAQPSSPVVSIEESSAISAIVDGQNEKSTSTEWAAGSQEDGRPDIGEPTNTAAAIDGPVNARAVSTTPDSSSGIMFGAPIPDPSIPGVLGVEDAGSAGVAAQALRERQDNPEISQGHSDNYRNEPSGQLPDTASNPNPAPRPEPKPVSKAAPKPEPRLIENPEPQPEPKPESAPRSRLSAEVSALEAQIATARNAAIANFAGTEFQQASRLVTEAKQAKVDGDFTAASDKLRQALALYGAARTN